MISIIVPVFNGEKYVDRCLKSLINQNINVEYEIILVNDGSTDSSEKICEKYTETKNVFLINQQNQGLSAARNTGIIASRGDFLTFIDVDDYVSPDYLKVLYEMLIQNSADISVVSHKVVYSLDIESEEQIDNEIENVVNSNQALEIMFYGKGISPASWAKMYKREIFKSDDYLFPVGRIYEDYATTYKYLGMTNKIAYTNRKLYFYYQHSGSILHSRIDKTKIDSLVESKKEIDLYLGKYFPKLKTASDFRFMIESMALFRNIKGNTKEDRSVYKILKCLWKPLFFDVLRDNNIPVKSKIRLVTIYMGYDFMRISWNIFENMKMK